MVAWGLPSYRIDWQRVSSHRIHRIHRSFACVFFPRNSQNLTDGVCLEFCEFREFCGTSHAPSESVKICAICGRPSLPVCSVNSVNSVGPPTPPSESVKICAICGRIILAAWVWQECHTLLQCYEGRGVHAAQQVAVEQCAGGAELVDIAVGGVGAGIRCVHVGGER